MSSGGMRSITGGLRFIRLGACVLIAVALLLCGAGPALAAPTVSNTADSGPGSLRQAIIDASPGDTITVPAGLYTLTSGALAVNKSLTLAGAGSASTTISGGNNSGVVAATGASTVTLSGLTVRDGLVVSPSGLAQGAGIAITGGGALTLDHVVVTANTASASATAVNTAGGSVEGAGVYDHGAMLTLRSSAVSGNFANSVGNGTGGGGSVTGGAIFADTGPVSLTDSAVDDNIINLNGGSSGGSGSAGGSTQGGALRFQGAGTAGLSLDASSVSGNRLTARGRGSSSGGLVQGGAINASGPGNIAIGHSTLDGNDLDVDGGGGGGLVQGGVLNCLPSASGATSITASTFNGGRVSTQGNGIGGGGLVQGGVIVCSGDLSIAGSTLRDTTVDADAAGSGVGGLVQGGALNFSGSGATLAVTDSAVRDSHVTARGGGASMGGLVQGAGINAFSSMGITLADSTLAGNVADVGGGATGAGGTVQAGAATLSGSGSAAIAITSTTVSGNSVTAAGGAAGPGAGGSVEAAGLSLSAGASGSVTLTNTTVSGNSAGAPGGGSNGAGGTAHAGGVQALGSAPITIASSTLAGNSTAAPGGGTGAAGIASGGNLYHAAAVVSVRNTIIAAGAGSAGKENCDTTVTSQGHNLESADECGFHGTGDQVGKDPLLAALADNGGTTQTRALAPGSPAVDAGGPVSPAGCPATDQRGVARPQRAACDVGAFELEFADLSLRMAANPARVSVGSPIAFTIDVVNHGTAAATPTVTDTLPAGVALISAGGSGAACAGTAPLTCTLPALAPKSSTDLTVKVRPRRPGTVANTAAVSSPVADPNPADNTARASALAVAKAVTLIQARLSPKTFALGTLLPRIARALPTSTTIRFHLSRAASVRLAFTRATTGRRSGRRCVRATRANTRRKRCTRYVAAGALKLAAHTGSNRVRFSGRLSKRSSLRPGRYRVTLVATGADRKRSAPRTLSFTLRPAPRRRR